EVEEDRRQVALADRRRRLALVGLALLTLVRAALLPRRARRREVAVAPTIDVRALVVALFALLAGPAGRRPLLLGHALVVHARHVRVLARDGVGAADVRHALRGLALLAGRARVRRIALRAAAIVTAHAAGRARLLGRAVVRDLRAGVVLALEALVTVGA